MEPVVLQEISRYQIPLPRSLETSIQWNRSALTVRTNRGLVILDLTHDFSCFEKKIDVVESLVALPQTSPASKLFTPQLLKSFMSNLNYNQMIINPIFWPHNPDLMKELASFTAWQYSPPEFLFNGKSIIAAVTNLGQVDLFCQQRLGWTSILSLSDVIEETYDLKMSKPALHMSTKCFEELKCSVSSLETSAMCWGPAENCHCWFVTAQKNRDILFWTLQLCDNELKAKLVSKIKLDSSEIVTLHWIPKTGESFLLIYSNILGELALTECVYADNSVSVKNVNLLWKHQDRMVVRYLKQTTIDDKIVLLFVKHRHLVVQVLDTDNVMKLQHFQNVNDNRITSLVVTGNQFYLCTENCKIFKINVAIAKDRIELEFLSIHTKDTYSGYALLGIDFSPNGLICAVVLVDKTVTLRKEQATVDIAYLLPDSDDHGELNLLFDNPAKKLTELQDCVELIRYKAMKFRTLPLIDYRKLYAEAETDLYKLKLYLIFVILYDNLQKTIIANIAENLPETSMEKIKENILAQHAQNVLDCLFKSYQLNGNTFTDLQAESFMYARKFIEFFCEKRKSKVIDFVNTDIFEVVNIPQVEETCQFCDDVYIGYTCKNRHFKMCCCVTFTPITSDMYLYCTRCHATARFELLADMPTCTFCDLLLDPI